VQGKQDEVWPHPTRGAVGRMELEDTFNRLGGDPVEGDPVDIIVTRSLSLHSHLPSAFTSTAEELVAVTRN
jgi:hypothetical protein